MRTDSLLDEAALFNFRVGGSSTSGVSGGFGAVKAPSGFFSRPVQSLFVATCIVRIGRTMRLSYVAVVHIM